MVLYKDASLMVGSHWLRHTLCKWPVGLLRFRVNLRGKQMEHDSENTSSEAVNKSTHAFVNLPARALIIDFAHVPRAPVPYLLRENF